jgi:hypothetical protein
MPITPTEADFKLQSKFDAKHKEIVEHIDNILCAGERSFTLSEVPRQLHTRIMEEYRQAGWHVRIVPDSKDGDYFEFSEPHR